MGITIEKMKQNIAERRYEPNVPYNDGATKEEKQFCRERYRQAGAVGVKRFRDDLEECFGTGSWPSASKMYDKAWDDGHSYGFHEVFSHYMDLVEVVRPTMDKMKKS